MTTEATINVGVSSHYKKPSYESEQVTQGILGERVELLEKNDLFSHIGQEDGYRSWISSDQLHFGVPDHGRIEGVRSHFLSIFDTPRGDGKRIRDAVIGCRLRITDQSDGWYQILLPDNTKGWAEKVHFGQPPDYSPHTIVRQARDFLGYQYTWGGSTPKGFDCSGFVQTVFRLTGVLLPRDAHQQQQQNFLSDRPEDAHPGDLLFFGRTPDRVTHVAISLGKMRFIHASGWIRENSLSPSDDDFSERHLLTFISVNRHRP